MKNWQKWLLGFIFSIAVIIGIGVLEQMNKQEQLKQEMIKVVESEEAKAEFEEVLKNLDSKALTAQGKIRSYKIDLESIRHNPMGGIIVKLIVNDNTDYTITIFLGKKMSDGKLHNEGGSYSSQLDDLLKRD
ncbi:DUF1310 family protein [Streptococcus acidominimus]|uniref:DUF1310 family protein n=1 Tax=Streptococcus acidominimus TaxID=1326 RepID=A0A4Y9FJV1_STRAI|nr:DUF1310 family protein [Streptococcus acidominimus]MBF0819819.1 DUF1310 family protein [Streptococcus acidominimus]MBF0838890.1 DUF1310 family protein [Streptococcus acidominimus]MBF0847630.1 DUF1310 family protein [Streptococcus danieliae]TFU29401.1 DUF1310 family protein [Streptococcus acidominimus]